jgi:cytochrome b subunit of formate dehydrogenase
VVVIGAVACAWADDPDNCLFCHQYRGLSRFDGESAHLRLFYVDPDYQQLQLGPHSQIACTDCHERSEVTVVPHKPVTKVNCTRMCHLSRPDGVARLFSHENVAGILEQSAHSSSVLDTIEFDGGPLLEDDQARCLYCHDEPLFRETDGVAVEVGELGGRLLDRCNTCHSQQIPVDTSYFLRHVEARLRTARAPIELAQVCAVCHSDATVLATHDMHDAVSSFLRSFHGKAALLGAETTADCVSCHVAAGSNAHAMLGPQSPDSAVNPVHVADSCQSIQCHPGAAPSLARAGVHLDLSSSAGMIEWSLAGLFIVLTICTFGPSLLIAMLELGGLVVGRKHEHEHKNMELTRSVLKSRRGRVLLRRFTLHQRIQHWILVVLFALLAMTGFPMKFADKAWAASVIHFFGGLSVARQFHHVCGILLVIGFAYHMLYALTGVFATMRQKARANQPGGFIRSVFALPMWISIQDGRKMLHLLAYLLLLRPDPPTFGRFSVKEKFEYIGVFWGTTLLGVTGAVLWGEQIASHFFSGRWLNIALIAHTYEAFLAIIHVGILHIVNVMLSPNVFPLSLATITGQTPAVELAEMHSEQVEEAASRLGIGTGIEEGAGHG